MELHTWLLYSLAVLGLSLVPGPNSLLVITHGALFGRRRTLATILGGALGFSVLIALSIVGIGAVLQAFAQGLLLMKLAGGAYLVVLGLQLWRSPPPRLDAAPAASSRTAGSAARLFRQGFLTALSNPKVLLFYAAFLPQFISPDRPLWLQCVVMAVTFTLTECAVECALASLAWRVRPWLDRFGRGFHKVCGGVFVAMGVSLPLAR